MVTDSASLLLWLILILRFGAKNWINCKDGALFVIRQGEFEWWDTLEALAKVRHRKSILLDLKLALNSRHPGHTFPQVCLEARVVKGPTKTLSDCFTYLCVAVLLGHALAAILRALHRAIGRRSTAVIADLSAQIPLVQLLLVIQELLCQALG